MSAIEFIRMVFRPVLRLVLSKKAMVIVLSLCAFYSFYLVFEKNRLLKMVPTDIANLKKLGRVSGAVGTNLRKLKNDSLHLPLKPEAQIYEDDLASTGDNATVDISVISAAVSEEDTFTLLPNSIVRISQSQGYLLLEIKQGAISANLKAERQLIVKTGTLTKNLRIKKGFFLIKNSTNGIQITAYDQRPQGKKEEPPKTSQESSTEDDGSKEAAPKQKTTAGVEAVVGPPADYSVPLRLPYPEDKQIFLLTQSGESQYIVVTPKSVCAINCSLEIRCETGLVFEGSFAPKTTPSVTLRRLLGKGCKDYQWHFQEGTIELKQKFTVQPFKDDLFNKYLSEGLAIELL